MSTLQKVVCTWGGFDGAPGYSVFYRGESDVNTAHIATFFEQVKSQLGIGVSVSVASSGDLIDDGTGELLGSWTTAVNTTTTSSAGGVYAAATGCVVRWQTGAIVGRHRLSGRTFLVPLQSAAFQNDGTILAATITQIQTAATTLISSEGGNLKVWHRPHPQQTDGSSRAVVNAVVPDKVAILRSRRD